MFNQLRWFVRFGRLFAGPTVPGVNVLRVLVSVFGECLKIIINSALALVTDMQRDRAFFFFNSFDGAFVDGFKPPGQLLHVGDRRGKA